MEYGEQDVAWLLAQRAILADLVRVIRELHPTEGAPEMINGTIQRMQNSLRRSLRNIEPMLRERLLAIACAEIDSIMTAPLMRDDPPSQWED